VLLVDALVLSGSKNDWQSRPDEITASQLMDNGQLHNIKSCTTHPPTHTLPYAGTTHPPHHAETVPMPAPTMIPLDAHIILFQSALHECIVTAGFPQGQPRQHVICKVKLRRPMVCHQITSPPCIAGQGFCLCTWKRMQLCSPPQLVFITGQAQNDNKLHVRHPTVTFLVFLPAHPKPATVQCVAMSSSQTCCRAHS
jgi:hypothetical protein